MVDANDRKVFFSVLTVLLHCTSLSDGKSALMLCVCDECKRTFFRGKVCKWRESHKHRFVDKTRGGKDVCLLPYNIQCATLLLAVRGASPWRRRATTMTQDSDRVWN